MNDLPLYEVPETERDLRELVQRVLHICYVKDTSVVKEIHINGLHVEVLFNGPQPYPGAYGNEVITESVVLAVKSGLPIPPWALPDTGDC